VLSMRFILRILSSREGEGLGGVAELELESIVRAVDKEQEGGLAEENG
jgi:hypothetical protein